MKLITKKLINRGNLRYWLIGSVCLHIAIFGVVRASSVATTSVPIAPKSPEAIKAEQAKTVAARKAKEKRLDEHTQSTEKSVDTLVDTLNTLEEIADKEAATDRKKLQAAAQNAPKRAVNALQKSLHTQKALAEKTAEMPLEEQHKKANLARAIQEEAERAMSLLPESEQKKIAEKAIEESKKQGEKFETEFDSIKAQAFLKDTITAQEKALKALQEAVKNAPTEAREMTAATVATPETALETTTEGSVAKKKKKHPGKPHDKKCFAPGGQ
jgi:hypothetical protein